MTDVPTTPRGSMSTMRRLRIFEDGKGRCILCERPIRAGDTWTVEHRIALGLGGADTDDNCGPAHEICRRLKDKTDVAAIAKAKRIKAKHYGAFRKRSTWPTGRDGPWKAKIGGGIEPRS